MAIFNRIQDFIARNVSLIGPLLFVAAIVVFGALGKGYLADAILSFKEVVENSGFLGYLFFVSVFVAAALSGVLPLSLLAVLGGMVFGLINGFLLAMVGIFIGGAGAFLLGRYVMRSAIERWLTKRVGLARLDTEIGKQGWRLVGLLRLSPFAPFSMASYAFSMTRVTFGSFMVGTIGVLPSLFAFVYTGSFSSVALNALLLGETELNEVQMVIAGIGLIATVIVALMFVRIARRALINQSHD